VPLAEGGESDQDYAGRVRASRENEPSEVLVLGQKNRVVGKRKFHYLFVDGAVSKLAHREHVVTLFAQRSNRGEITALVREKAHSAGFTAS
jgi:hypothetical protein